jgi:DNA-binding SARP family transcriptional activator
MDERERKASIEDEEFERELHLGHHSELLPRLASAAMDEPLRERRWRLLMVAFYRSGRPLNAHVAFGRLRSALRETGQDPSPESYELEDAIAQGSPDLDWSDSNPH